MQYTRAFPKTSKNCLKGTAMQTSLTIIMALWQLPYLALRHMRDAFCYYNLIHITSIYQYEKNCLLNMTGLTHYVRNTCMLKKNFIVTTWQFLCVCILGVWNVLGRIFSDSGVYHVCLMLELLYAPILTKYYFICNADTRSYVKYLNYNIHTFWMNIWRGFIHYFIFSYSYIDCLKPS